MPPQVNLLERVASGDGSAVRACIQTYGPMVLAIARRMGLTNGSAEDLVQEVFIDLWRKADRYDSTRSSEAAYISMIARRRLIDHLRRNQRRVPSTPIEELELPEPGDALERIDQADEARRAQEALGELKAEERQVILLSVQSGLSHTEIADSIGMPLGTVKSHLRRGLQRVREALGATPPLEPQAGVSS